MNTFTSIRILGAATIALAIGAAAPAGAQSRTSDRDEAPRADRAGTLGSDARTTLGLSVSMSGGDRDTLGVLISSVVQDGPAERAGVADGNRLAAINGVNLRLSPNDVGDKAAEDAVLRNLSRELRNAQPGDELTLRVYSAGRARTVTLQLPAAPRSRAIPSRTDDSDAPPTPSMTISAIVDGLARIQAQLTKVAPSCTAGGSETIAGLGVSAVATELAPYFGEGSEDGLLVLKANTTWSPLRPGDVILRIDGEPPTPALLRTLPDARNPSTLEVLRRKRVIAVSIPAEG